MKERGRQASMLTCFDLSHFFGAALVSISHDPVLVSTSELVFEESSESLGLCSKTIYEKIYLQTMKKETA